MTLETTPYDEKPITKSEATAGQLEAVVSAYVADYEMRTEPAYAPTEWERQVIEDAIQGLLADDEFIAAFNDWQAAVRGERPGTGTDWQRRAEKAEAALREIALYTGEGPRTTPWQAIVKDITDHARAALDESQPVT